MVSFVLRQYGAIRQCGWPVFFRKAKYVLQALFGLPLALLFFLIMRTLRPWILIRLNPLDGSRVGHLAGMVEIYLCERDAGINVPWQRHLDLCYFIGNILANQQLATMWGRQLRIWPAWLLGPVFRLNRLCRGGLIHEVGENTHYDRDVHNLYERMPPHLSFTPEEESRGKAGLRAMGIPDGAEFICLLARDSAYLDAVLPGKWDYHSYRDVDIKNYILMAEALADSGYFVIRMGSIVRAPINSCHPKVIDYAVNGMRSDFMDVYLGGNCMFCISCSAGFDAVPIIFRRPIAYVNMVPIGCLPTYLKDSLGIFKKHWLVSEQRFLSLGEIFRLEVAFCGRASEYEAQGVEVIENTPEEIKSLAIEMIERLRGGWRPGVEDEVLQRRFWDIYLGCIRDARMVLPFHGKVRARFGAQFLRDNREWLE